MPTPKLAPVSHSRKNAIAPAVWRKTCLAAGAPLCATAYCEQSGARANTNHPAVYPMRIVLNIVGALCLLMGGTWFLQGVNILPGSFMTGQSKWAVYGGVMLLLGAGVLYRANRGTRAAR